MAYHAGPAYMRTSRPKTPVIYDASTPFKVGGSQTVRSSATDTVTLVGAGITLFECLAAHEMLKAQGVTARVIDLYCLQPIDTETLQKAAKETGVIVTVEDHYPAGGIGEAVMGAVAPVGGKVHRDRRPHAAAQRQAGGARRQVRPLGAPHRGGRQGAPVVRSPPCSEAPGRSGPSSGPSSRPRSSPAAPAALVRRLLVTRRLPKRRPSSAPTIPRGRLAGPFSRSRSAIRSGCSAPTAATRGRSSAGRQARKRSSAIRRGRPMAAGSRSRPASTNRVSISTSSTRAAARRTG